MQSVILRGALAKQRVEPHWQKQMSGVCPAAFADRLQRAKAAKTETECKPRDVVSHEGKATTCVGIRGDSPERRAQVVAENRAKREKKARQLRERAERAEKVALEKYIARFHNQWQNWRLYVPPYDLPAGRIAPAVRLPPLAFGRQCGE